MHSRTRLIAVSVSLVLGSLLPATAFGRTIPGQTGRPESRRSLLQKTYAEYETRTVRRAAMERQNTLGASTTLPQWNVRFSYPKDWDLDTEAMTEGNVTLAALLLSPVARGDTARQNINLVVEDLSTAPLTLTQYTEEAIRRERDYLSSFVLHSRDRGTVAGERADIIQFEASFAGIPLRYEQAWFIRGTNVYIWTFTDASTMFDEHLPTFRAVVESMTFSSR